jgi:hypothetical protein
MLDNEAAAQGIAEDVMPCIGETVPPMPMEHLPGLHLLDREITQLCKGSVLRGHSGPRRTDHGS